MSKILRRPMFRGGPVDSYGTGIASGLASGGRVGLYRGGSLSYNPFQQSQTSNLLGRNAPKILPGMQGADIFAPVQITGSGFSKYDPGKSIRESQPMYEEFAEVSEEMPSDNIIASADKTFVPQSIIDKSSADVELGLPTSKVEDLTTEKVVEKVKDGDDEVEVTMTDLEKALGLDKARRRDLGDMLGRASAAFLGTGDVREGLAEFMAAEAKAGPSRTERIKSIAGLEEFKADRAEKLFDKKTDALLKQKEGTKGAFQKKLDTILKQPEGSQGHKIALIEEKFQPTIQGQIGALTRDNNYTRPSPVEIIGFMDLYYPQSYKGTVSATEEMTGKEAGTYITKDATQIIFWDGTKATGTQSI